MRVKVMELREDEPNKEIGVYEWPIVPNKEDYFIIYPDEYCVSSRTFDFLKEEIILRVYWMGCVEE